MDLVCGANIIPRKPCCGEGINTWDKFELRVHEHRLIFLAPQMLSNKSPQSPLNLVLSLMSPLLIPKSTCLKKISPTANLGKMKYLII